MKHYLNVVMIKTKLQRANPYSHSVGAENCKVENNLKMKREKKIRGLCDQGFILQNQHNLDLVSKWKELSGRSGLVVFLLCSHEPYYGCCCSGIFHMNLVCLPGTLLTMFHPVTTVVTDVR